jgi:carboxymethylenebutenolidase
MESSRLSLPDLIDQAEGSLITQGCGDKIGLIGEYITLLLSLIPTHESTVVYGSKSDYAPDFEERLRAVTRDSLVAAIFFDTWDIAFPATLLHLSSAAEKKDGQVLYKYADILGPGFIIPGHSDFKVSTAGVAHTRSVGFIKKHLGGPFFDLESIWDEHTFYEFGDRSVEKTMATMVQEPYVNHVPTVSSSQN